MGKTQVTVEYDGDKALRVDTVVISTQHDETISLDQIRSDLKQYVIQPTIPASLLDDQTKYFINPTGRFVIGGPVGDTGLTGRKIIIDTYGGYGRHGGGAFSGKDPTKVDRSGAYAARYVAKNIVAAGLARKCEVQIAYAIGVAKPVSIMVETFGTSAYSNDVLAKAVHQVFDLRPKAIIQIWICKSRFTGIWLPMDIWEEKIWGFPGKRPIGLVHCSRQYRQSRLLPEFSYSRKNAVVEKQISAAVFSGKFC